MDVVVRDCEGMDREKVMFLLASAPTDMLRYEPAPEGEDVIAVLTMPEAALQDPLVEEVFGQRPPPAASLAPPPPQPPRAPPSAFTESLHRSHQDLGWYRKQRSGGGIMNTSLHKKPAGGPSGLTAVGGEARTVKWTLKLVEEVLAARCKTYLAPEHAAADAAPSFYHFAFNTLCQRLGLDSLVESTLADLVFNAERYYHISAACELFADCIVPDRLSDVDVKFLVIARSHMSAHWTTDVATVRASDGKAHAVPRRYVANRLIPRVVKAVFFKHPHAAYLQGEVMAWLDDCRCRPKAPRAVLKPNHVNAYELLKFMLRIYSTEPPPLPVPGPIEGGAGATAAPRPAVKSPRASRVTSPRAGAAMRRGSSGGARRGGQAARPQRPAGPAAAPPPVPPKAAWDQPAEAFGLPCAGDADGFATPALDAVFDAAPPEDFQAAMSPEVDASRASSPDAGTGDAEDRASLPADDDFPVQDSSPEPVPAPAPAPVPVSSVPVPVPSVPVPVSSVPREAPAAAERKGQKNEQLKKNLARLESELHQLKELQSKLKICNDSSKRLIRSASGGPQEPVEDECRPPALPPAEHADLCLPTGGSTSGRREAAASLVRSPRFEGPSAVGRRELGAPSPGVDRAGARADAAKYSDGCDLTPEDEARHAHPAYHHDKAVYWRQCDGAGMEECEEMDSVPAELLGEGGLLDDPMGCSGTGAPDDVSERSRVSSAVSNTLPAMLDMTHEERAFYNSLTAALKENHGGGAPASANTSFASDDFEFRPDEPHAAALGWGEAEARLR
eukprot:TRINITY_DN3049_c1_g1_i1.p1 TRINITY_DN3049_c1_g1~~TRINITY_DN3049_c1_g1_i1.p1  ORF type:complete len:812 (+),score=184.50 TRINITY_DN3049_c1_g1_i1:76-2436(+)